MNPYLEGVEVERLHGAGVFVLREYQGALLAGDDLAGVVHRHQALVEAANDHARAAESGIRELTFVQGLSVTPIVCHQSELHFRTS